MTFSLIICTYMRPQAVLTLLNSVAKQKVYPNEILIVDGSTDARTTEVLEKENIKNLLYFKVPPKHRGLTKQRNFGISKLRPDTEVVCFLDDDIVLTDNYFSVLLQTYSDYPKAMGVGGYIINEIKWKKKDPNKPVSFDSFEIDGWYRKLGSRNVLRKRLGLLPDCQPCIMPEFSNGYSVANLPPNDRVYQVDYFMGGVSSFKKEIVDSIKFSTYFEGYGLYEDMDYCLRVSKNNNLYVNTAAKLYHYHEEGGRPNKYQYGKMVVRNGWYVWRVKYPKPSLKARVKWNAIAWLLTMVRLLNVITTKNRKEAFSEAVGRTMGWLSLYISKPNSND